MFAFKFKCNSKLFTIESNEQNIPEGKISKSSVLITETEYFCKRS